MLTISHVIFRYILRTILKIIAIIITIKTFDLIRCRHWSHSIPHIHLDMIVHHQIMFLEIFDLIRISRLLQLEILIIITNRPKAISQHRNKTLRSSPKSQSRFANAILSSNSLASHNNSDESFLAIICDICQESGHEASTCQNFQ